MKLARLLILLSLALVSVHALPQQQEGVRVSLVTCSPGDEVYSLYGHTAIRCTDTAKGLDLAFNYGVFSFNQPHFIWNFVLGRCDYMLCPVEWDYFLLEYRERGSSVTEQVLNLMPDEAAGLLAELMAGCRMENRRYRYNFLFNNCTTKVRDAIEHNVAGHVVYPDTIPLHTFRQMLRHYASRNQWAQEGNDLLLGADVDTMLTARSAMFAPEYMMRYAANAVIRQDNNDSRPLVEYTCEVLPKRNGGEIRPFPLQPLPAALCFLALCLALVVVERWLNLMLWPWDVMLLLAQGLVGCLLLFMSLFSQHPGVGHNWLLWLFNPLALFSLRKVAITALRRGKTLWHAVHFSYLTLFMIFSPWIPQDFGNIVVPLALAFMTRPFSYYLYYRKNRIR